MKEEGEGGRGKGEEEKGKKEKGKREMKNEDYTDAIAQPSTWLTAAEPWYAWPPMEAALDEAWDRCARRRQS